MAKAEIQKITEIDEKVLEGVVESIKSIQYGTVTITVHDGKVTQIETSRKQRYS
ncbi:MAG: YezD family protein [Butyrivibrio sp.]|nr:YezD family protein [Butyrivibrio sp.]